jgi:acetylglutamate kinase
VALGHSAPNPAKSRIATTMGKARILMEAMPFIQAFRGKTIVIKYGGSAMADEQLRHSFAGDVTLLSLVGIKPVVVHGGGPQINEALRERGIESEWVEGLRVSDARIVKVVQSVLAGEVNPDIVRLLIGHDARAAGITGIDGGLFGARPKDPKLGFVGEVTQVDPEIIFGMFEHGLVPVIAPLARGLEDGQVYNVNADTAAGVLASELGAEKLVYLTDVEGLYGDVDDDTTLIQRMTLPEAEEIMTSDSISGGMLPKLEACVAAMQSGVSRSHILDGRVQHALLLEIFTPEGIGTMIRQADEG